MAGGAHRIEVRGRWRQPSLLVGRDPGQNAVMPSAVLMVVSSLVVMVALLAGVTWFEQRMLSPRSIILHTARCRSARVDHVEALVQVEAERLLAADALAHPVR